MKPFCPFTIDESLIKRKSIEFSVIGRPVAKQRPRASRRGRYITVYTPRETTNYENMIRRVYREDVGTIKLQGPLEVQVDGYFEPPKSISKKKRQAMLDGSIDHISKPDCDNLAKSCLDALNGIAYDDDSQINKLIVTKQYGDTAKVDIRITEKYRRT
jgi:Holliday junction resolvase RusA-like endonuclease